MALSIAIQNVFKNSFEKDCIELLINAYSQALSEKKYQSEWYENDFTEMLCCYINSDQVSIDREITAITERKLLASLNNQTKGYADKLSRLDLVLFRIWSKNRYTCQMEAKRLKEKDSTLKRAYINEGMDRFISQKYPLGNMVGYLLEGNEQKTVEGINKLLLSDGKSAESLVSKTSPLHSSYYESDNHANIGQLKHIILDFT
ncbi:hypothetical protein [Psychrobacter sp. BF1]|uniref:hypothetical protein n=1 Tax=Psychrobacter sp. BF1 TaxID=2821147 RepID=UPI001C4DEB06|nr:hypothetical protein [Psychrobacter sp. BF1]